MKLKQVASYIRDHGVRGSAVLTADRLFGRKAPEVSYELWQSRNRPSSHDYLKMEKSVLPVKCKVAVTAMMNSADRTAFFQSLEMQVYREFRALKNCNCPDYILIVNGPCTLRPDLLWECVSLIGQKGGSKVDLIYFDSDRIGRDGKKERPAFRPDFDPDLLEGVNYMGNVVFVNARAARLAGPLPDGDESFHAFLKRICLKEKGKDLSVERTRIRHIPKVLYHVAEDPRAFTDGEESGWETVTYAEGSGPSLGLSLREEPLISVLIPNRDHSQDLRRCIDSLRHTNTWKRLEILILENHSTQQETFDLYRQLEAEDPRIRILTWDGPFNYSAINQFGAALAKGEYLLLLNNDTQILAPESLARMEELLTRPEVGAVGAVLLYPEGSVQHAGIILGHGGIAGHAWQGERLQEILDDFPGLVFSHTHNVSAVTGACMMIRKDVWEKAGGMDESLEVTFNDVDLCMRLRKDGYRVLMCPAACLLHYESASRGSEDSPAKVRRFHREIGIFVHRWEKELEAGDPFYNPCLTLKGKSWTCKDDLRESTKPYVKYLKMM